MRRSRLRRSFTYREIQTPGFGAVDDPREGENVDVGHCVRAIREQSGFSLRALADQSGVSVNTLSLIENGKSSPSVSTLQKISGALQVPIVSFFLPTKDNQKVVYSKTGRRKQAACEHGILEDMGAGLSGGILEPFVVTLEPEANSGPDPIVHTGYEFVFCLTGKIAYVVENQRYILEPGDSLFFESDLPHCWQNLSIGPSQKLLILCPIDEYDRMVRRHPNPDQGPLR